MKGLALSLIKKETHGTAFGNIISNVIDNPLDENNGLNNGTLGDNPFDDIKLDNVEQKGDLVDMYLTLIDGIQALVKSDEPNNYTLD